MATFRVWWLFLIIPALLAALVYGALWSATFDHSAQFSRAVLSEPDNDFDDAILSAALSAKFPRGTPIKLLEQFATDFKGSCYVGQTISNLNCGGDSRSRPPQCQPRANETVYCDVPLSGTICIRNGVAFRAPLQKDGTVTSVFARRSSVAC